MKKIIWIISMGLIAFALTQPTMAQGSIGHSAQAVIHSAQASGHAILGSIQLVSAAGAIPLQLVGAIGAASGQAGDALMRQSEIDFHKPLTISDEVITAGPPPSEALYTTRRQAN